MIIVDILLESTVTTNKGMVILPPTKISDEQRHKISLLVTSHLDSFSNQLDKTHSGRYQNKSYLPPIYDVLGNLGETDQVFQNCFPRLVPQVNIIDEETVQITLPSLKSIPEGESSRTKVTLPGASQLVIWKEESGLMVLQSSGGVWYSAMVEDKSVTSPVLTIRRGKVVSCNTGNISVIKELPSGKECLVLLSTMQLLNM